MFVRITTTSQNQRRASYATHRETGKSDNNISAAHRRRRSTTVAYQEDEPVNVQRRRRSSCIAYPDLEGRHRRHTSHALQVDKQEKRPSICLVDHKHERGGRRPTRQSYQEEQNDGEKMRRPSRVSYQDSGGVERFRRPTRTGAFQEEQRNSTCEAIQEEATPTLSQKKRNLSSASLSIGDPPDHGSRRRPSRASGRRKFAVTRKPSLFSYNENQMIDDENDLKFTEEEEEEELIEEEKEELCIEDKMLMEDVKMETLEEKEGEVVKTDDVSGEEPMQGETCSMCFSPEHFYYLPLPPRISILVRNTLFQTYEATLETFPDTLLGNKNSRDQYFNNEMQTYMFDRCPRSFDSILFYYQSPGILSQPHNVGRRRFVEEIEFFQLHEFLDKRHEIETAFLNQLREEEDQPKALKLDFFRRVFGLKQKSRTEMIFYLFYLLIIGTSIGSFCLATLPELRHLDRFWFYIDVGFCILLTIEYVLHLFLAKNPRAYITSFQGLMDLVAVLPTQCFLLLQGFATVPKPIVKLVDFLRVSRVIKCFQTSRGLRQVSLVLYQSKEYILLLVVSIFQSCIVFSWLVYEVEEMQEISMFPNYLDALWYAIITATGVGYGDLYPQTIAGKILGSWLAVLGVLLFCLPTSKLLYKFVEFFYLPYILTTDKWNEKRRQTAINRRNNFLEEFS